MSTLLRDVGGGVVMILIAGAIGIAQNTIRPKPVELIQRTPPVSTAQGDDAVSDADAGAPAPVSGDSATASGDSAAAGESSEPAPAGVIDLAEMKRVVDAGRVYILDARSPDAFAKGHIPGAINIPYDELPKYVDSLTVDVPLTEPVVCYCWSKTCDFSDQLATELKYMGYQKVRVFKGGWEEWTGAKYPTEGAKKQ